MPAPAVLVLMLALAAPPDTTPAVSLDTAVGPVMASLASGVTASLAGGVTAPVDTVRRRRKSVDVGEWYERRLRIHRYGSYAVYPLFALQAVAGNQIYRDQRTGPEWAKNSMRYGATALAGVFTSNTVTGLWNLWDSRSVPQGRTRRVLHALLMLGSDAGFTYAGSRLAEDAETSSVKREAHRNWAYGSMAATLAGIGVIRYWPED